MGCICGVEGFGGVTSQSQYSEPSRDSHSSNTKVEAKPYNKVSNESLEPLSLNYPDSDFFSPEIPNLYLNSKYRDRSRDCDDSETQRYGAISTVVGHPYYCPIGWKFIGIKINERETKDWAISYHGTSLHVFNAICEGGYKVGPGGRYGRGVYSSPNIEVASQYAQSFTFEGVTYIGVLQNRVNQNGVNIVNGGQYWVCPNPANIIPCGLCVKEVARL